MSVCIGKQGLSTRRKWQPTPVYLAWRSPWTEEHDGQQSTGLQSRTGLKQLSSNTWEAPVLHRQVYKELVLEETDDELQTQTYKIHKK